MQNVILESKIARLMLKEQEKIRKTYSQQSEFILADDDRSFFAPMAAYIVHMNYDYLKY